MNKDVLQLIINHTKQNPLNLIQKNIEDEDIKQVIETILKHQPQLQELHLDNNNLSDQGALMLAEKLGGLKSLTLLSIQFNQIDVTGAKALFSVQKECSELEILFRGNKIKDAGLMHEIEMDPRPSLRF